MELPHLQPLRALVLSGGICKHYFLLPIRYFYVALTISVRRCLAIIVLESVLKSPQSDCIGAQRYLCSLSS
jgi:hypothetical protein